MSSDWVSCCLDDFLLLANGKTPPERSDQGSYPVYGANGAIGRCQESNAVPGTTVIGRVGSYCGSLHHSTSSCWVTDNAIKTIPRGNEDPRFCYYCARKDHLDLLHTYPLVGIRAFVARIYRDLWFVWFERERNLLAKDETLCLRILKRMLRKSEQS